MRLVQSNNHREKCLFPSPPKCNIRLNIRIFAIPSACRNPPSKPTRVVRRKARMRKSFVRGAIPFIKFGAAAMDNGQAASTVELPVANFPKQAIVVIHGMGEQMPMDTIKGFVRAVWETVTDLTANGLPNPAEVWSKPDVRTGSLELRRI